MKLKNKFDKKIATFDRSGYLSQYWGRNYLISSLFLIKFSLNGDHANSTADFYAKLNKFTKPRRIYYDFFFNSSESGGIVRSQQVSNCMLLFYIVSNVWIQRCYKDALPLQYHPSQSQRLFIIQKLLWIKCPL